MSSEPSSSSWRQYLVGVADEFERRVGGLSASYWTMNRTALFQRLCKAAEEHSDEKALHGLMSEDQYLSRTNKRVLLLDLCCGYGSMRKAAGSAGGCMLAWTWTLELLRTTSVRTSVSSTSTSTR